MPRQISFGAVPWAHHVCAPPRQPQIRPLGRRDPEGVSLRGGLSFIVVSWLSSVQTQPLIYEFLEQCLIRRPPFEETLTRILPIWAQRSSFCPSPPRAIPWDDPSGNPLGAADFQYSVATPQQETNRGGIRHCARSCLQPPFCSPNAGTRRTPGRQWAVRSPKHTAQPRLRGTTMQSYND